MKRLSLYLCLYLITLWLGGNFFAFAKSKPMIAVTAVEVTPLPHLSGGPGLTENKKGAKARATVVLNNCIRINEIEIYPQPEGDIVLRYPGWIDKSGRDHPQIELLTRQAREAVRESIRTRRKSPFQPQTQKFRIVRIKKFSQTESSTKAFCVVNFNEAVNLHCKVLKGKWGLWIGWPCKKEHGAWLKQVEIIDRALKKSIKTAVLKKYRQISPGE